MNSAFAVVFVAAVGGLASMFAVRPLSPSMGPFVALAIMATALLVFSRRKEASS
jgi:hypothetical protein